jgi:hypothetical protein
LNRRKSGTIVMVFCLPLMKGRDAMTVAGAGIAIVLAIFIA